MTRSIPLLLLVSACIGAPLRTYQWNEWPTGPGPPGYGEDYLATTTSYGADPADKPMTTYFRTAFSVGPNTRKMYLRLMYDDGFVFYINGKEGGRASMPAGPVTFSTAAWAHEASNQYVTFDISAQLPNVLPNQTNTLAFEVHQASPSSSDLVFDAELVVWEDIDFEPHGRDGIDQGAYWRFWDQGGDLGSAWRQPDYDASGWSSAPAPLGFGEDYIPCAAGLRPGGSLAERGERPRRSARLGRGRDPAGGRHLGHVDGRPVEAQAPAGLMFWLTRKRFCGSYLALIEASRW
jgi:hypothetical protein